MAIIGIVAVAQNGAIGKGGKLPWHYSADMKHFQQTTIGHACVMGYKTWLTLKRPLKDRLNIVLSRQSEIVRPDVIAWQDSAIKGQDSVIAGQESVIKGQESVVKGQDFVIKGQESVIKGQVITEQGSDFAGQKSVITLRNLASALSLSRYLNCDLFVIGGAKVYESFLPYIEKWIVTEVPLTVEGADAFVPEGYLENFKKTDSKQLEEGLTVSIYERNVSTTER